MHNIRIERPKQRDKESINQFFETVIIDTFKKNGIIDEKEDLNNEIETKRRYLDQDFDTEGKDRFFLLAYLDNNIAGSIEYGTASDTIQQNTPESKDLKIEVGTVFVHPEYQHRGIGKILLKSIFTELMVKKIDSIYLDSGYPSAQNIWSKKFGKPRYFLKDYWGNDEHHMIWILKVEEIMVMLTEISRPMVKG